MRNTKQKKEKILLVFQDVDGCVFHSTDDDLDPEALPGQNQGLIDHIVATAIENKADRVIFINGSARQSACADNHLKMENKTTDVFSAVNAIKKAVENQLKEKSPKIAVELNKVTTSDAVLNTEHPGTGFELQNENWGLFCESKIAIAYLGIHHIISKYPKSEIMVSVYDDRKDLMHDLAAHLPPLLPKERVLSFTPFIYPSWSPDDREIQDYNPRPVENVVDIGRLWPDDDPFETVFQMSAFLSPRETNIKGKGKCRPIYLKDVARRFKQLEVLVGVTQLENTFPEDYEALQALFQHNNPDSFALQFKAWLLRLNKGLRVTIDGRTTEPPLTPSYKLIVVENNTPNNRHQNRRQPEEALYCSDLPIMTTAQRSIRHSLESAIAEGTLDGPTENAAKQLIVTNMQRPKLYRCFCQRQLTHQETQDILSALQALSGTHAYGASEQNLWDEEFTITDDEEEDEVKAEETDDDDAAAAPIQASLFASNDNRLTEAEQKITALINQAIEMDIYHGTEESVRNDLLLLLNLTPATALDEAAAKTILTHLKELLDLQETDPPSPTNS